MIRINSGKLVVLQVLLLILNIKYFLLFPPRIFYEALLIYWAIAVVLMVRKVEPPGPWARGFISFGFFLIYAGAFCLDWVLE